MAAAAVDNHNANTTSCLNDPNFATICSFIDKFGETCNLGDLPFDYLQEMLENSNEVPPRLIQIHIQLLRRVYKSINTEKWEKHLAKFGHSYNAQDGWEIERFGYKKAKIQTKIRLLKTLLEAQFDFNVKFKNEVNKLPAEDLRRQPIGRDSEGQLYWYQVDPDANLRIYREDVDDETWEVVASNREEMLVLIEELSSGIVKKNRNIEEGDGDGGEASPKEIILDTGKVQDDQVNDNSEEEEDDDDDDAMQIDETYRPPVEDIPEVEQSEVKSVANPSVSDLNNKSVQPVDLNNKFDESTNNQITNPNLQEVVKPVCANDSNNTMEVSTPKLQESTSHQATHPISQQVVEPSRTSEASTSEESNSKLQQDGLRHENSRSSEKVESNAPINKPACSQNNSTANNNRPNDKKANKHPPSNFESHHGEQDLQLSIHKHFKEPSFLPPPSKGVPDCIEPSNNDIWNPAVQDSSKSFPENSKLLNLCNPKSSTQNQHRIPPNKPEVSANWSQLPKTKGFQAQPSPLDNLMLFTEKMSVAPNTLTENLRKVTDIEADDACLDQAEMTHRREIDYGEKFIKPESSASLKDKGTERLAGVSSNILFNEGSRSNVFQGKSKPPKPESFTKAKKVPKPQLNEMNFKDEKIIIGLDAKPHMSSLKTPIDAINAQKYEVNLIDETNVDFGKTGQPGSCKEAAPVQSLLDTATVKGETEKPSALFENLFTPVPSVEAHQSIIEPKIEAELQNISDGTEIKNSESLISSVPSVEVNQSITEPKIEVEIQNSSDGTEKETSETLISTSISAELPLQEDCLIQVGSHAAHGAKDDEQESLALQQSEVVETLSSNEDSSNSKMKVVETSSCETHLGVESLKSDDQALSTLQRTTGEIQDLPSESIQPSTISLIPPPQAKEPKDLKEQSFIKDSETLSAETSELKSTVQLEHPISLVLHDSCTSKPNIIVDTEIPQLPIQSSLNEGADSSNLDVIKLSVGEKQNANSETNNPALQGVSANSASNEAIPVIQSQSVDEPVNKVNPECHAANSKEPVLKTSEGSESKIQSVCELSSETPPATASGKIVPNDSFTSAEVESNYPEPENPVPEETKEILVEKPGIPGSLLNTEENATTVETEDEPPVVKTAAWLVGYEDSSSEDDHSNENKGSESKLLNSETENQLENSKPFETSISVSEKVAVVDPVESPIVTADDCLPKRKTDAELSENGQVPEKKAKLEDLTNSDEVLNPIVGEAIEEEMMIITGEGSGAELQGGNDNSPVGEEFEQDEIPSSKGKSRGRPKRKEGAKRTPGPRRKSFGNDLNDLTPTERSVTELNGSSNTERPMRQSRRIAQIREKEEVERRKLEEEHLAQLKKAQLLKQQTQKQKEQEQKKAAKAVEKPKSNKSRKVEKGSKGQKQYLPTPSASESESDNEELFELPKGKKKRGRQGKTNGEEKFKKGLKPWLNSSSDDEDEAVEEEEEEVHEEEEIVFDNRSDHEFSPESDLGEEEEISPSRHARTVKIGPEAEDKYAKTVCDKCLKGDHPEWILLCDVCDKGWHASCVTPQLWVIPEGEWFCPPCQHSKLVEKLGESLVEFDKILKKRENDEMRRKRLAYVGISMENVIPHEKQAKSKEAKSHHSSQQRKRRRILSDEDESDLGNNFIDDNEDGSKSSRYNSEDESDDEPMYKLRARRATKAFNFKEYDDMINSALRDEDYESGYIEETKEAVKAEGVDQEEVEDAKKEGIERSNKHAISEEKAVVVSEKEGVASENELSANEKEEKRLQELEKASHRKTRRRLNDLDATSEDDSDEDFKGSNGDEDEDEENLEEDDSEWSGDREADDSDESISRLGRRGMKERKYGRREKFLEIGSVRRSTRRSKAKIQYDESDQEDDDNDAAEPWNSDQNSEESVSNSESDDATWGKRKKVKAPFNPPKSSMRKFILTDEGVKPKSGARRKKRRRVDEDDEDRPWNSSGSKAKKGTDDTVQQRRTRGKKINFKDILDSGESDDDGNIRPKRRRILSESDDSEGPSSSKKLAAELSAANLRAAIAENKERQNNSIPADVREPKVSSPPPKAETIRPQEADCPKAEPKISDEGPRFEDELKPVPAPPYPPVRNQLLEALKKSSEPKPQPQLQLPQPSSTSLLMSEILATPPIRSTSPKKTSSPKNTSKTLPSPRQAPSPIPQPQPAHRSISQHITGNIPPEISKMQDPTIFQRAAALRAFHPAWGRSSLPPPPYGNHLPNPPTTSAGKPPPLSSVPFMSQNSARSNYPAPPPLRIPSPNSAPLQSFHHFKRGMEMPMFRLPPNLAGLSPRAASLLPQMHPGLGHPHLERFYGPPGGSPFGVPPYGLPPPHSQSQPMFSAPQSYDFRHEESFNKDDSVGAGSHGALSTHGQSVKDEISSIHADGEFGGLVSYFSSQRGDDDLDT